MEPITTPAPPSPKSHSLRWGLLVIVALGLAVLGFQSGLLPHFHPSAPITAAKPAPKYHCPMHPSVVSDKPGPCPICGMDLVPIGEGGTSNSATLKTGVPGLAVVSISPQTRQTMGLKLGVVEKRPVTREIRTSARISAAENRLWRVTTKSEGWVNELFIAYAGQEVRKGDPLLTIYSPALVSAQAEYLNALRARSGAAKSSLDPLVDAARKRLELWDISADQIERLARTGTIEKYVTLYAPASGVVISRDLLAGQKIGAGDPLMVIADLSTVWGEADLYQSDLPYVKVGMPLTVALPYWPGKTFDGKIIFVSPTLDAESRTLKARLEIPNPEGLLKPGMFGDAHLQYELGNQLTLPAAAVMLGGKATYAFRDNGDGHLVPTPVQIGVRTGDAYELLSGLNEGDRVVVSANFLVDSESNLKAAMEAMADSSPSGTSQPQAIASENYAATLAAYLKIQQALSEDDLAKARSAARDIPAAQALAASTTLETARKEFKPLSDALIAAAQQYGAPGDAPLVHEFCPMAFGDKGADWLQPKGPARNPYLGKEMLECAEPKGEIAPRHP